MRKNVNDDRGTCPCPTCSGTAKVRKDAKNRLYLVCAHCNAQGFQDYVLENATMYGPDGAPEKSQAEPVQRSAPVSSEPTNDAAVEELAPVPNQEPENPVPASAPAPESPINAPEKESLDDWFQSL